MIILVVLYLTLFFLFLITSNVYSQKHSIAIKDTVSLIKYVEPILFEAYGREHILAERPYKISIKKGIWTVDGSLSDSFTKGGAFHIEVKAKDGKVVKLIHYK